MTRAGTARIALGALAMLAAGGCRLLDRAANPDSEPRVSVHTAWYAEQPGYAVVQPAISGELVFSGTADGHVLARSRTDGRVQWNAPVGERRLEASNLLAAAGVVVAPVVFQTVGLDAATGAKLWTYEAPPDTVGGGPLTPGPVSRVHIDADAQNVFVPAWGGTVAAVDLHTGAVRWTWKMTGPGRSGAEGVRLSGGRVYATVWHFLNETGTRAEALVVALDAATGAEVWRTVLPSPSDGVCTAGRPEVVGGRVVAMMVTGEVFGLDPQTGVVAWHVAQEVPGTNEIFNAVFAGPAVGDGMVYADGGLRDLRAIRASDGAVLWRTRYGAEFKADLLVTGNHIYGAAEQLHVFDRRTGKWQGVLRQPHVNERQSFFPTTPAWDGSRVYVPANGALWAFDAS